MIKKVLIIAVVAGVLAGCTDGSLCKYSSPFDNDKNNKLSKSEYAGYMNNSYPESQDFIRKLSCFSFEEVDTNNDGEISANEMTRAFKKPCNSNL